MSYKALYDILCSVKRHMNARVIFRWSCAPPLCKLYYSIWRLLSTKQNISRIVTSLAAVAPTRWTCLLGGIPGSHQTFVDFISFHRFSKRKETTCCKLPQRGICAKVTVMRERTVYYKIATYRWKR